jgi:hypothetical protein
MSDFWTDRTTYSDQSSGSTIRCLSYGEPGTGKTTFACTFPKPIIVNTDDGAKAVEHKHIPIINVAGDPRDRTFELILKLFTQAKRTEDIFSSDDAPQTIIIDGYTTLAQTLKNRIMKETGKDPIKDKADFDVWGALLQQLTTLTEESRKLPVNVVFTCWSTTEKDELTGEILGIPNIQGSFRRLVAGHFDEVYYHEVKSSGDNAIYRLHTRPYRRWTAKSRIQLPKKLPPIVENPSYNTMFEGAN